MYLVLEDIMTMIFSVILIIQFFIFAMILLISKKIIDSLFLIFSTIFAISFVYVIASCHMLCAIL